MNVVHILENLNVGGLERLVANIVLGLDKDKFQTKVWCLVKGGKIYDELQKKGIEVEIVGLKSSRDIISFTKLVNKLKHENIDIVHTHGITATNLGRIAAKIAGIPVIIAHMHSTYFSYSVKQRVIDKVLSWFSSIVVCCSEAVADFIKEKEKISHKKIEVIYNGVDTEKFQPQAGIEKKGYMIGCVASLFEHKGHKYLLEAMVKVLNEFSKETKLLIIGEGVLRKELESYAKELKIDTNVKFCGEMLNISEILPALDIVILPSSLREGLGLSLLEAMSCGVPVIGTNIGGIPEIIGNSKSGLLVAPGNHHELSSAIIKILSNKDLAKEMGELGRKITLDKFSQKIMMKKIESLYIRLVNEKRSR